MSLQTEAMVTLAERLSAAAKQLGTKDVSISFLAEVRSKLIGNYNFSPAFAEQVLLAANMPAIPDDLFTDNQLSRLAVVYADNINFAYDAMIQAGFGSAPDALASYIGRGFKTLGN